MTIVFGLVMVIGVAMPLGGGTVFADPPGVAGNPAPQQSGQSGNCIAEASAVNLHNGQAPTLGQGGDPSHGTRGDEIKALQDSCAHD